jgi:hypothetical protein
MFPLLICEVFISGKVLKIIIAKKVNRKPGKKRVKILMDDNSSDDEPKITKFQVTSVHDGKKLSFFYLPVLF